MRKLSWTAFLHFLFLAFLVQAGCVPTPGNDDGLPGAQNLLQGDLTATITPPTNTSTPVIATTLPPTPTIDQQAVLLAQQLAPQFTQIFGVMFNPSLAKGLDAARIGGPAGHLAEMIAPVVDANQRYTDRSLQVREVVGLLSLNDSRLDFKAITILNKGTIQFFPIPLGVYMVACHRERPNDCLAVSLQREEFQINPETVSIITIPNPPGPPIGTPLPTQTALPTGTACLPGTPCPSATSTVGAIFTATVSPTLTAPPPPSVGFEEGSIETCFTVFNRKVCITVF